MQLEKMINIKFLNEEQSEFDSEMMVYENNGNWELGLYSDPNNNLKWRRVEDTDDRMARISQIDAGRFRKLSPQERRFLKYALGEYGRHTGIRI